MTDRSDARRSADIFRRCLRWRLWTTVIAAPLWLSWLVLMFLLHDLPGAWFMPERIRSTTAGAWGAGLVPSGLSGAARAHQKDILRDVVTRWRGPGTVFEGSLTVLDAALLWTPSARCRDRGAREIRIGADELAGLTLLRVSDRYFGIVARGRDGSETSFLTPSGTMEPLRARLGEVFASRA